MASHLVIDSRFRGPVRSGNGGVSAGLVASLVNGSATVRLRRPPPIDRPLIVVGDDTEVRVLDGDVVVLEARPGKRPVAVPVDDEALGRTFERGPTRPPPDHVAPQCFVCSEREDGMRVSPQWLSDTELWSTVWTPDGSVRDGTDHVLPHVVWGVLDCPAGFAVSRYGLDELTFFAALSTLTADLRSAVPIGEPVGVFGWAISADERRVNGGSAIIDGEGTVLATAYAEHARLPVDFAADPSRYAPPPV